jgi:hypothetical protein
MLRVVVDVERDGPSARANSVFAVGGVEIDVAAKRALGGCSYNFKEREDARNEGRVHQFWQAPAQAAMYARLHQHPVAAREAMQQISARLSSLQAAHPEAEVMFASGCLPFDMRWLDES